MGIKEDILVKWGNLETVMTMAAALGKPEDAIRVYFKRLEKNHLISETGQRDTWGYKIYSRTPKYVFEGEVTSSDWHGEAPDIIGGDVLNTLLELYGKKVKVTIEVLE